MINYNYVLDTWYLIYANNIKNIILKKLFGIWEQKFILFIKELNLNKIFIKFPFLTSYLIYLHSCFYFY